MYRRNLAASVYDIRGATLRLPESWYTKRLIQGGSRAAGIDACWREPSVLGLFEQGVVQVTLEDDKRLLESIERFARYFQREFGYDLVQFSAKEWKNVEDTEAFLVTPERCCPSSDECAVGALCFRKRLGEEFSTDSSVVDHWALQWAWLHPYERNKGVFRSIMPALITRFGKFYPEPPLSRAMEHLVKEFGLPENVPGA